MNSLVLYLIVDVFAVFFCFLSEKSRRIDNKKKYLLYISVSIALMGLLVGLRSLKVGTDTYGYANVFYRIVDNNATEIDTNWLSIGYIMLAKIIRIYFWKKLCNIKFSNWIYISNFSF